MTKNKKEQFNKGEIAIYQAEKGEIKLSVKLEDETIWLSLDQIAGLFGRDKSVISRHLKNVFAERELEKKSVVAKFATTAQDGKIYQVDYYNLDVIISIGYRVKSKQGTHFRIWANKIIKNYLVKGYVINQKRLLETKNKFKELQETINFLSEKSKKKNLLGQEIEILDLLRSYSKSLTLLEEYDKNKLKISKGKKEKRKLNFEDCLNIIKQLKQELIKKKEASDIFGNIRDGSFEGIVKGIYQTFGGRDLYQDINAKSAHILYLIIKDHPFTDGNKRIASFLFVYFLHLNNYLCHKNGEKKINNNALVALALLVAESKSKEKDIMIKLIMNLIK